MVAFEKQIGGRQEAAFLYYIIYIILFLSYYFTFKAKYIYYINKIDITSQHSK